MNPPAPQRRAGHTMIEVVVVVAVIAIVAGIAAPMLGHAAGTRLASAARILAADIDRARVATLTRADRPTILVFNEDRDGYRLAHADTPDHAIDHPTDPGRYEVIFGQGRAASLAGVTITAPTPDDPSTLAFGRYGQLTQTTPAHITLADNNTTLTLTIDPTSGEVTIGQIQ